MSSERRTRLNWRSQKKHDLQSCTFLKFTLAGAVHGGIKRQKIGSKLGDPVHQYGAPSTKSTSRPSSDAYMAVDTQNFIIIRPQFLGFSCWRAETDKQTHRHGTDLKRHVTLAVVRHSYRYWLRTLLSCFCVWASSAAAARSWVLQIIPLLIMSWSSSPSSSLLGCITKST